MKPVRAIYSEADLANFIESKIYGEFLQFIKVCGTKVRGCPAALGQSAVEAYEKFPVIAKIVSFFNKLQRLTDDIPPIKQPMRFGNKAFRQWFTQVVEVEISLFITDLLTLMPNATAAAVNRERSASDIDIDIAGELGAYLAGSFGNEVRIDYGTGHETSLAIFFYCLCHPAVRLVSDREGELQALILYGFGSYLTLMRHLQEIYMLEPAGSHGVWGLDDYQCLLFVWGSAQVSE